MNPAKYRDVADAELLRPIHDEEQYRRVLSVVEGLVLKVNPSPEELEYLDALTVFVERYEQECFPLAHGELSRLELLEELMKDSQDSREILRELAKERGE